MATLKKIQAWAVAAALGSILGVAQGSAAEMVESVLPRAYSDREINSCIQSVCGPAQANISNSDALTLRENESATFGDFWTRLLEPKITEKFSIEAANDKLAAKLVPAALREGFSFRSEKAQMLKAVIGLRVAAENVKTALLKVTHAQGWQRVVNEKELGAYIEMQPASQRGAIALEFRLAYLVTMAANSQIEDGETAAAKRLHRLYPSLSIEQATAKDTAFLLGIYSRIGSNLGPQWQEQLIPAQAIGLIKRAATAHKIDDGDSQRYADIALTLQYYSLAFRKSNFAIFVAAGSETGELLEAARSSKAYAEMMEPVDKLEQKTSTLATCRPRLAINLSMNASEFEIRQMKKMADVVKAAALTAMNRLSANDHTAAQAIERIKFVYPQSSQDKRDLFVAKIDEELVHQRARAEFSEEAPAEFHDLLLMELIVDAAKPALLSDPTPVRKISQIELTCANLRRDAVSDNFASNDGFIEVSWFAVNYPEVGLAIMAHELGHVVSNTLRKSNDYSSLPMAKTLTCVANRNPFNLAPSEMLASNMNSATSEEDFADHFSSLVMNELVAQGNSWVHNTKNLGCALVNDVGGKYRKNSLAADGDDVHSSGLLRLLMTAVDRGQMTPQCAPLIEYAASANRELKCR